MLDDQKFFMGEVSMNEAPVNEAPVNEAPVNEAPVNEAPVNEAPVNEAPVNEAPVNETTSTTSKSMDDIRRELDTCYGQLVDSLFNAKNLCKNLNNIEKEYRLKIENQSIVVQRLQQMAAAGNQTPSQVKEHVKQQHCQKMFGYIQEIMRDVEVDSTKVPGLIRAMQEELQGVDVKVRLIDSLKELDGLYHQHQLTKRSAENAERRFQDALVHFGSRWVG